MNKEELIKYIMSLPDDATIAVSDKNEYGCIDVKIFDEKKSDDFLEWYFGP